MVSSDGYSDILKFYVPWVTSIISCILNLDLRVSAELFLFSALFGKKGCNLTDLNYRPSELNNKKNHLGDITIWNLVWKPDEHWLLDLISESG